MIKANPSPNGNGFAFNLFGDPNGIRTHDTTVKGWCLNRLTMGPKAAFWWLRTDSNHRPVGYEPNALAS